MLFDFSGEDDRHAAHISPSSKPINVYSFKGNIGKMMQPWENSQKKVSDRDDVYMHTYITKIHICTCRCNSDNRH